MKQIIRKKHLYGIVVLAFCMLLLGSVPAHASAKSKALKAYQKLLSGSTVLWDTNSSYSVPASSVKFALAYIDKDSVPELVLYSNAVPHAAGYSFLYVYKNGKAVPAGTLNNDIGLSYYKKKGIIVGTYTQAGWSTATYIKLSGKNLIYRLQKSKDLMMGRGNEYYKWNKAGTSRTKTKKAKFNSALKKLVGSRKAKKVKFYQNTAANRKKRLK